jgi:hypothetical protein
MKAPGIRFSLKIFTGEVRDGGLEPSPAGSHHASLATGPPTRPLPISSAPSDLHPEYATIFFDRRVESNCATERYGTVDSHHDIFFHGKWTVLVLTKSVAWYQKWNCCYMISMDRSFYYARGSHDTKEAFYLIKGKFWSFGQYKTSLPLKTGR